MTLKKKRTADLTLEVLKDIRDDVRNTNLRLDGLRAETRAGFFEVGKRFEEVAERFGDVGERFGDVGRRIVDSEVRTATAITDLTGTLHEIRDDLRESRDLRPRVDLCEREIAEIKTRLEPERGSTR